MSREALFTTPLKFDLGASWCAGVIALLKSQSLLFPFITLLCYSQAPASPWVTGQLDRSQIHSLPIYQLLYQLDSLHQLISEAKPARSW